MLLGFVKLGPCRVFSPRLTHGPARCVLSDAIFVSVRLRIAWY